MPVGQLLRTHQFLRHNLIFFTGSFLTAVLNYLFYPVLGRVLSVVQFGETQVLVAIFMQLTIFFTVTSIVITNIVSNAAQSPKKLEAVTELERLMMMLAFIAFVLLLLLGSVLQNFFHLTSVWPIYALALALLITFPLTVSQAYLRGIKDFASVTVGGILGAAAKLLLSAVLVILGWQTFGAIFGIALAQILALLYTRYKSRRAGWQLGSIKWRAPLHLQKIRPQLTYALFVMIVTLAITWQFSIDILIVKRFFSPELAGLYAGISTIARILYFLTASVSAVLLSSVHTRNSFRQNRRLLLFSLALLLALGGGVWLVFWSQPSFIVTFLMGVTYQSLAGLLPGLSGAVLLVSFINLLLTYCLSLRLYRVLGPLLLGVIVTYLLLIFRHSAVIQIVQNLLWGSAVLLILIGGWLTHHLWQESRQAEASV